jgi:hypothetical protein
MKRTLSILIPMFLVVVTGCSLVEFSNDPTYVPNEKARMVSFNGPEPGGFNGIPWEANLSTVGAMKHIRTDPSHGGIAFYRKEGDTFQLENGKRVPVQYGFWKEKFYVGLVNTEGLDDWNALKQVVFGKYGVGARPFLNKEDYLWVGKVAVMALRFDEYSKVGTLYIRSDVMTKQMDTVQYATVK